MGDGGEVSARTLVLIKSYRQSPKRVPTILVPKGRIDLDVHGDADVDLAALKAWVKRSGSAVADWFAGFPVRDVRLDVHVRGQGSVQFGEAGPGATPQEPPELEVWIGADATTDDFRQDWVLVHEMLHLAVPGLTGRHRWFKEGLATYVEPQVRVAAGLRNADEAWAALAEGVALGEPGPAQRGLNNTESWARTYWGGAAWCLAADVGLREASDGELGLVDAQRGVIDAGGTLGAWWTFGMVLDAMEEATGTGVLQKLYQRHARRAHPFGVVDLLARAKTLGIVQKGKATRKQAASKEAGKKRGT